MTFIHDDFLLQGVMARRLYHEVAEDLPIIDYHCHLPPEDVAVDRKFANLFEIWLQGDHYKWRAMRTNGVAEQFCTGDADPYDKFVAWAETVPYTLRNPLYHWTHLELKRYFGIDVLLNGDTAREIWDEANRQLAEPKRTAHGILEDFKVEVVCTTDDPVDSLAHHKAIGESGIGTKVIPAFRPDAILKVDQPELFNAYCDKLATATGRSTRTFDDLIAALKSRHDYFHDRGCRLSDHGLSYCHATFASEAEVVAVYEKARASESITPREKEIFATHIMLLTGRWDAERGWVKQLHLGALRNNNTRRFKDIGADTGFDSIGDWSQAENLSRYLDRLDQDNHLPKTILYNVNPRENYVLASMLGNFQEGGTPGKLQFGSGWWFLDQREGMEWQLNALSNLGLLSRFVGMLTDSRSFMSYPRHEYFRRIFCNMLGEDVAQGSLPGDFDMLSELVRNVCYHNAKTWFPFT
ncbi:MAG: glucuronate isomerase [Verrucomicrobiales bacterium]